MHQAAYINAYQRLSRRDKIIVHENRTITSKP
jgi:hypothetical protein